MANATSINRFMRQIEGVWPDPETPGWNEVQLECGHLTQQPKGNTNLSCQLGQCKLDNQKHLAELAKFEPKETPPDARDPDLF